MVAEKQPQDYFFAIENQEPDRRIEVFASGPRGKEALRALTRAVLLRMALDAVGKRPDTSSRSFVFGGYSGFCFRWREEPKLLGDQPVVAFTNHDTLDRVIRCASDDKRHHQQEALAALAAGQKSPQDLLEEAVQFEADNELINLLEDCIYNLRGEQLKGFWRGRGYSVRVQTNTPLQLKRIALREVNDPAEQVARMALYDALPEGAAGVAVNVASGFNRIANRPHGKIRQDNPVTSSGIVVCRHYGYVADGEFVAVYNRTNNTPIAPTTSS